MPHETITLPSATLPSATLPSATLPSTTVALAARAVPGLRIVLPDRRTMIVDGVNTATTLSELVAMPALRGALESSRGGSSSARGCEPLLTIDGRIMSVERTLIGSGIRDGSRIDFAQQGLIAERPVCVAVWVRGVDAGGSIPLLPGIHYIGRASTASIRCADPALELHHAVLAIGIDAVITINQLAGLHPVVVDGIAITGATRLAIGQRVEVGNSVLIARAVGLTSAESPVCPRSPDSPDPWRTPWIRSPRPRPVFDQKPLDAPRTVSVGSSMGGGLLPAVIGVIGAAVLALVFDQLMFLLFGAMGAVVALGTWLAQKFGLIRSRRSARRSDASAFARFTAALEDQRQTWRDVFIATTMTIDRALTTMVERNHDLWSVRNADTDAFRASLGEVQGSWRPEVVGVAQAGVGSRGWATVHEQVSIAIESASRLGNVPVATSLGDRAILALAGGDDAVAVARSLIVQLAAASGPADWRLAIVTDRPHRWQSLTWLPHAVTSTSRGATPLARIVAHAAAADLIAGLDPFDDRHLVIVIDQPDSLASRGGPLRRLLAGARSVAAIVICDTEADIPAVATSALVIGRGGHGRWVSDTTVSSLADLVRICGLSDGNAGDAAASIAGLIDPEASDASASLAHSIGAVTLLAPDIGTDPSEFASRIAAGWRAAGRDPAPSTPIGIAADGVVEIDLVRDGPHGLLAGTTGSGKSELLRSLVLGLATRSSPETITFVLIDYKGGSTFDACAALPHTVGLVTDLDDRLAARALRSLEAELRRREMLLRSVGANDLGEYRRSMDADRRMDVLPRLVVVIDEFATLVVQQPDFIGALLGIAQRGRSLGVHLLLATQRPSGVLDENIRANTNLRIALRVQDAADSTDVIGDHAAAHLPRSIPGRAIMRLGGDEAVIFQTAQCTTPNPGAQTSERLRVRFVETDRKADREADREDQREDRRTDHEQGIGVNEKASSSTAGGCDPTQLDVLVEAICVAARINGTALPHRPGLAALTSDIGLDSLPPEQDDLDPDALGVIDDPDSQTRRALTWTPADGHTLLFGSPGSGTTTALVTIAASLESWALRHAQALDLFVIDANGDTALDAVGSIVSCAGLVRLHERERVARFLDHLTGLIENRRTILEQPAALIDTVVMIDGFGALRADLDATNQWRQLEQLERIVAEGPSAGLRVLITAHRIGSVPSAMLSQIARRWVFHLADPLEVGALGLKTMVVPMATAGRLFDTSSGCEAQIVARRPRLNSPHADRPLQSHPQLGRLDECIAVAGLPEAAAEPSSGDVLMPIGRNFDDLGYTVMVLASGEHAIVVGPARSGRSTALRTIADRWSTAHPDGWIGCVAPRRSSAVVGSVHADLDSLLAATPADVPVLVVVDDAELVDDASGAFAARISRRSDHFNVVAAGRAEGLRAGYGHWTTAVRRSRLGLVMAAANDLDGDLLGAILPRRLPIPSRPGLAWLVADGACRLVQIAQALDVVGVVP